MFIKASDVTVFDDMTQDDVQLSGSNQRYERAARQKQALENLKQQQVIVELKNGMVNKQKEIIQLKTDLVELKTSITKFCEKIESQNVTIHYLNQKLQNMENDPTLVKYVQKESSQQFQSQAVLSEPEPVYHLEETEKISQLKKEYAELKYQMDIKDREHKKELQSKEKIISILEGENQDSNEPYLLQIKQLTQQVKELKESQKNDIESVEYQKMTNVKIQTMESQLKGLETKNT